tara:strand:+ start:206 stop:448 length:243 start_codon:yes stop_codon:yes gene_type:complete
MSNEPAQAVVIPPHIFVELYSTIADEITMHICNARGFDMYPPNTKGDDVSYSDEAQEIFNGQSDYAEQMLELCGIIKGDE